MAEKNRNEKENSNINHAKTKTHIRFFGKYSKIRSGFNYWDGHNWKTVVLEREHTDDISHEILENRELVEELNNAIENKEFLKSEFGKEIFQFEGLKIVINNCQGSWASYEITEIEEED